MREWRRAIGRVNPISEGKIKIRGDHSTLLQRAQTLSPVGVESRRYSTDPKHNVTHDFLYSKTFEKEKHHVFVKF